MGLNPKINTKNKEQKNVEDIDLIKMGDKQENIIASPKLPNTSPKQNEKAKVDSIKSLEYDLLKTSWVKEAQLIQDYVPVEDLTKTQQKLIQKCIDKEDFTDKQLTELKLILNKYRKILLKIKPDKAVEQVDTAIKMMQSEKDFINMMSPNEHMTLLVHINTYQGKVGFNFIVHPINDSRVIETLELQVDLFRDYSTDEQLTYAKGTSGQELTPDEQKIYDRMNKEIIEKQGTERISSINRFLANQLTLENTDSSFDERLKFWEVFPFNSKVGIFIRVQDMLGLSETKNSELFPSR